MGPEGPSGRSMAPRSRAPGGGESSIRARRVRCPVAGYLSFKAHLVPLILSGTKTQTLRRTVPRSVILADEIIALCSHAEPPFATLIVTAIDRVAVADLDHGDARREGTSLPALLDALAALYPDAEHLMRVQFRLAAL